ncbi:MAG: HNH endonuclease [Nitrosotalea sp.]
MYGRTSVRSTENLHWEHIIPRSKGGPDTIDNMAQACQRCNLSKSDKDLYEWYGKEKRYDIPRLVLGKVPKAGIRRTRKERNY